MTNHDIEYSILNSKIRKSWPKEGKYEIIGFSLLKKELQ